jgi:TatD DNase family protein
MRLFDAHCHLQFPQYQEDLPEVLSRMRELDMGAIVVGTDLTTSKEALALAKQHDFLFAAVGMHPNDNPDENFEMEQFLALAQGPKVVAIGECGLDYFRTTGQGQRGRLLAQIELAEQVHKPLIIHCRNAHEDMLALLAQQKPNVPVIIHFCTVSGEVAKQYLDLGCYLSFPGPVTFTDMYDDSIRLCPMEKLLIETDAPFAAPTPHRGKRNEPSFVSEVAKKIGELKGMSADEVALATVKNASLILSL